MNNGKKKEADLLNALANPVAAGDIVVMCDGSEWHIYQDLTNFVIVPPVSMPDFPRLSVWAQVDLVRHLLHINEQLGLPA